MISTVAPRLDNDSHALPALKRRPRLKPSLRDEEKIRAMRKNVGNDKDGILSHIQGHSAEHPRRKRCKPVVRGKIQLLRGTCETKSEIAFAVNKLDDCRRRRCPQPPTADQPTAAGNAQPAPGGQAG